MSVVEPDDAAPARSAQVRLATAASFDSTDLIDTFLDSQTRAIRWQLCLAIFFLVTGAALLMTGNLLSDQIGASFPKSALVSLGGVFVSTLCALPIKDLISRREKADALRLLKKRLDRARHDGGSEEMARIDAMLWKALNTLIER